MERSEIINLKGLGVLGAAAMGFGVYLHFTSCRFPPDQIGTTKTECRVLRNAVCQWQLMKNEYSRCPSVEEMIDDRVLDPGQRNFADTWGTAFRIECRGEGAVIVSSAGQDEVWGTADDHQHIDGLTTVTGEL